MLEKKKTAIIYDWFDKWGGVERILLTLHEIFPDADFYTSYYDIDKAFWAEKLNVKTSFIQQLPNFIKKNRVLSVPFYPYAFESFNLNDYQLVISVTSSFAKSVITQPGTRHICYLLTPTRFLWSHAENYINKSFKRDLTDGYLSMLREWDKVACRRPDKIISISETVKDRCRKYYKRESEVIYPPFDIAYWEKIRSKFKVQKSKIKVKSNKFFLLVSRLERYKKIDLAVKVFNKLKEDLVIVGTGNEEDYLKKISRKNISFFSNISDYELAKLYAKAEALIMPQEEDFGYVSLEAQFFGCPVISYMKGGATESIVNEKTGFFFKNQTESSLRQAIARYSKIKYNLRTNIKKFSTENISRFDKKIFINKLNSAI